jgi:hypothetical protein
MLGGMVAGFHDCANNCRSIVLSILAEAPDRVSPWPS